MPGTGAALRSLVQYPQIVSSTSTGNWNSGVATSGNPGADLFTRGVVNQWWKLQDSYVLLSAFNAAATVTIRAYMLLMGAEREVLNDNWVVALDGEVAFIVWFWNIDMFGPLRIEVFSNVAADDGVVVPYEYRIKDW